MKILVAGTAALHLLARREHVADISNRNDYYHPTLKEARAERIKK